MKKVFLMLAAVLTIGLFVSCSDDDDTVVNNGGDETTNPDDDDDDDDDDGGYTGPVIDEDSPITIDGYFNDWEALEETEDDTVVTYYDGSLYDLTEGSFADLSTGEEEMTLRNLKVTSSANYVYVYFEVLDKMRNHDQGAKNRGTSVTGNGLGSHYTPGPIWVYIDSDNNTRTGLQGHVDSNGAPYIAPFAGDNFISLFDYIDGEGDDKSTWEWGLSWSQLYIWCASADNLEYISNLGSSNPAAQSTICYSGSSYAPDWDNLAVDPDDFMTEHNHDDWNKVEMAVNRANLFSGQEEPAFLKGDDDGYIQIAVLLGYGYKNVSESYGHTAGKEYGGVLPEDGYPLKLKLK